MKLKYKYIVFDFDDTLFDYNKSEEYALKKALDSVGIAFNSLLVSEFRKANRELWEKYGTSSISPKQFYHIRSIEFLRRISEEVNEERFTSVYTSNISKPFPMPYAFDVLSILSRYFKICIATNGPKDVREKKLNNAQMTPFISRFFSAEELGASKPQKEFYRKVLNMLNAQKEDVLFVGDNFDSDVIGAYSFGADVCYIPYKSFTTDGYDKLYTYRIRSLIDLFDIVFEKEPCDVYTTNDDFCTMIHYVYPSAYNISRFSHGKSTYVFEACINDEKVVFKFPRTRFAAITLMSELQNSICLRDKVSIKIPIIDCALVNGRFFCYYPRIEGENLSDYLDANNNLINTEQLAKDVANIISEFASIPAEKMPMSVHFKSQNMRCFINDFAPGFDLDWLERLEIQDSMLIHGDLHRSNVLVSKTGRIVGVLDLATVSKSSVIFDVAGFIFSMRMIGTSFGNRLIYYMNENGYTIPLDIVEEVIDNLDKIINDNYLPYIKHNT